MRSVRNKNLFIYIKKILLSNYCKVSFQLHFNAINCFSCYYCVGINLESLKDNFVFKICCVVEYNYMVMKQCCAHLRQQEPCVEVPAVIQKNPSYMY